MNREHIQDLIRLANNNDNDNEANSAARMVCIALKDYTFPNEVSSEFDYKTWCQRHRKLKTNCGCK